MLQQQQTSSSAPYKLIKLLGQGGEGTVHLVQKVDDEYNEKYVMKKRVCFDLADANRALREALTLAQNKNNDFIVRFHDVFIDREIRSGVEIIYLCIVMELCDGGDIAAVIEKAVTVDKKPIDSIVVNRWCSEMARAIKYLHDSNTIHRDLKTENVFLTTSGSIKIGDFGLAQLLPKHTKTKGVEGTMKCMAPEVYSKKQYDSKADIFSLGCIWWELGANRLLSREPKAFCELAVSDPNYDPNAIASPISDPKLRALVSLMLAKDPAHRPSAAQILQDAYFSGGDKKSDSLELLSSTPSALRGAEVKQLHVGHSDEIIKIICSCMAHDVRYVKLLPGKEPNTSDKELCSFATTQLVKFAFESNGSIWGYFKDNSLLGVAALRRPYESRMAVTPWKALKFLVNAPNGVQLSKMRKFLLMQKQLSKEAKKIMAKRPFWHLVQAAVLPSAQNQGVGSQMLSMVLRWADSDKLPIFAEAWSELALNFLKKNGFKVVSEGKFEDMKYWAVVREPRYV